MKFILVLLFALVLVACGESGLPDVTGLDQDEAVEQLEEAGYSTRTMEVNSDEAEEGAVIRTRPPAGSEPDPEREIIVVVAADLPLENAWQECQDTSDVYRDARLEDDGKTLVLPGRGEDDEAEEMLGAMMTQFCVMGELNTPSSITARIESTRALDGVQTGQGGDFHYTWSYHPNSGLNLIIEETN